MLHVRLEGTDVDIVHYPYPLLAQAMRSPLGVRVASLRDLAAMKLAAIARRGLRRDFWDLYAILTEGGVSFSHLLDDYHKKFGTSEADAYHVLRALVWFEDAERDVMPRGLTARKWKQIRAYFEALVGAPLDT
ncbi:MAG: nucleotidyl transferase AbiEii/AbiGii toxin family protein [Sandaracinaceae bacterium]|nr:nucleotidyl transferase AbiEii/AbiGii toxin family protein [Sandaracinaceae bacterium]